MIFLNQKNLTPLVTEHEAGQSRSWQYNTEVYFEVCFEGSQVAINLLNLQRLWEENKFEEVSSEIAGVLQRVPCFLQSVRNLCPSNKGS